MSIKRIISGGQTGADLGGLIAGKLLGLETGGWAPKGWRTEAGTNPSLGGTYGLVEHESPRYEDRTRANVNMADATLVFGRAESPRSRVTITECIRARKPHIIIGWPPLFAHEVDFREWVELSKIAILNVAGNRESVNPGICVAVRDFLIAALKNV